MTDILQYNDSKILFGKLGHDFNQLLEKDYADSKKIIITDDRVAGLWVEHLVTNHPGLAKAEIIQIPEGEVFKTIEVCAQIWEALSEYEIGRSDLIINVGGGVITDLGGLVAALYKRGLDFINIPTTLLAQVDASVGGKTAVDLGPYKNQVGCFVDPQYVFVDHTFLSTLDEKQLISGYAEMLKHGLIADADYWKQLQSVDPKKWDTLLPYIKHSVNIKKEIVEQDHKESGLRKVLNFGHSIGHGIEGYFLQKGEAVLHGYAVAWGMIAESHIAAEKGLLDRSVSEFLKSNLSGLYGLPKISQNDFKEIVLLIHNDKKNSKNRLLFSLIEQAGTPMFDQEVTEKEILDALKHLSS